MMNLLKFRSPKCKVYWKKGRNEHNGRFTRNWKNIDLPANTEMREKIKFEGPLFYEPGPVDRPLSPLELFQLFFTEELIEEIVKESVLYAVQKGILQYQLSVEELKIFLAILGLLISGYCTVPRRRMYWEESTNTHNVAIDEVIDLKK